MANFQSLAKALAQDPATRRIWYGIATAHDLEAHDGMTEENLYQRFSLHISVTPLSFMDCRIYFMSLGNFFETWVTNPLKVKPIAHAIWDPHFGESAIKAFSKGNTYPVNIAYSGVYHWWYTIGFRTNQELYLGSIGLLLSSALLFAGWLHLQPKFRPSLSWFKTMNLD
jgi:photosystem I P700 chlorophyll a apoprotein A2